MSARNLADRISFGLTSSAGLVQASRGSHSTLCAARARGKVAEVSRARRIAEPPRRLTPCWQASLSGARRETAAGTSRWRDESTFELVELSVLADGRREAGALSRIFVRAPPLPSRRRRDRAARTSRAPTASSAAGARRPCDPRQRPPIGPRRHCSRARWLPRTCPPAHGRR